MWGDLVDRISNKDRPNDSSYKDTLAQPLKLKDSLRIRDGLGGYDARSVGWPQFKITRFTAPGLSYPWVSDN
jgi:hypothetical protein